jgi:hypothetical protein
MPRRPYGLPEELLWPVGMGGAGGGGHLRQHRAPGSHSEKNLLRSIAG